MERTCAEMMGVMPRDVARSLWIFLKRRAFSVTSSLPPALPGQEEDHRLGPGYSNRGGPSPVRRSDLLSPRESKPQPSGCKQLLSYLRSPLLGEGCREGGGATFPKGPGGGRLSYLGLLPFPVLSQRTCKCWERLLVSLG